MASVLASLLALAIGPALVAAAQGRRWVLAGVDGFVVVTIGGIVLLHMLPHAYLVGGPSMLLLAAAGLLGPTLLERVVGPRLPLATRWMLPVALLGLALHALLDGAVLVEAHDGHGHDHAEKAGEGLMALGVVLHRIPEGLAIWWVFRRRHGLPGALIALAVIAAATLAGFTLGEHIERFIGPLHGIQALVAGSLLHVIFHRSHDLLQPLPPALPSGPHAPLDEPAPDPATAHAHGGAHLHLDGDHTHDDHAHGDHTHDGHAHGDHAHGDHAHGDHTHGDHAHGDHAHGDRAADVHGAHAHGATMHGAHDHGEHAHGDQHAPHERSGHPASAPDHGHGPRGGVVPSSRLLTAPAPAPEKRPGHVPDALGALLGVAALWAISLAHPTDHRIASELGVGSTFALLALKLAPPLLLSYALVAVAHALWPRDAVGWLQRGRPLGQSLRALVVGPLAPVCSCGVLPLYEALRERAVSAPASLTLLLVTPGLSLVALVPSLGLLGAPLTSARLVGALVAAVAVGLAAARLLDSPTARAAVPPARASGATGAPGVASRSERLRDGLRYAVTDVVDHTAPWLLLGLGLGAFLEPSLSPTALAGLGALAVPLCALGGIPLYLCAAGLTPLLAVLLHKGLPPGAALAVLLTGPTLNVSVLRLLGRLHGPRVAWLVGALTLAVAVGLGLGADALITPVDRLVLHDDAAAAPGVVQVGSLAVLVALSLGSLVRRGPRFWAEQIVAEHPEH